MDSQNLSSKEQMNIIENALKQTSQQKTGASNYYIIWGFTLIAYFVIQFLNAHFRTETTAVLGNYSNLLFPVGGILSFLQSRKDDKTESVILLKEKVYTYSWIGASIGLGVLSIPFLGNFIEMFCVAVLVIFGLVNFIIGGITGFKPLLIGGVLSMLLTIIVPHCSIEFKFLVTALGLLFSCLIPGLIMKSTNASV